MFDKICNQVNIKGQIKAEVFGPDGVCKQTLESHNVIVTNGKEFLASYLQSAVAAAATFTMRYIGLGTDSTAEAVGNTALGTEVGRHSGTVSYISGAIYQVKATFATGSGTGAITEYGLFSSNTNGTMMGRVTSAVVNVGASDTLTVTYQLILS
jgi:hypothetical protein